jgi:hypothetical protein
MTRLTAGLVGLVGAAIMGSGAEAAGGVFELTITDAAGTTFRAACQVNGAGGLERVEIEGEVPQERTLDADAIDCTITQTSAEGNLTVLLQKHPGSVARSGIQGEGGTIRIRQR